MGIWIRKQNKEALIKANDIWADYNAIFANYVGDIHTRLGGYDSEAEAIQALDMIQEHINNLAYVQFYRQDMDVVPPVFQMPPAGFSGLTPRCRGGFCNLVNPAIGGNMKSCDWLVECKAAWERGCR